MGEDCDGTLTFTKEKGPVIMFGPSCDPPHAPRNGDGDGRLGGGLGDAANVGFATAVRLTTHGCFGVWAMLFDDLAEMFRVSGYSWIMR